MIITKAIAAAIIEKHKVFAPERAKVMLIHEDGRVVFAEKFEIGSPFWWSDTMRESKLQGVIHKLQLIAKRNDQGDWVGITDFSGKHSRPTAPKSRQDRILEQQESLVAARKGNGKPKIETVIKADPAVVSTTTAPAIAPAVKPEMVSLHPAVYPAIVLPPISEASIVEMAEKRKEEPKASGIDFSDFVSIRSLDKSRNRKKGDLFLSLRSNGKIILNKDLRDAVNGWGELDILVRRDFKCFALLKGSEYRINASGTYVNRALTDKIEFPDDAGTIRVQLEWDPKINSYIGFVA